MQNKLSFGKNGGGSNLIGSIHVVSLLYMLENVKMTKKSNKNSFFLTLLSLYLLLTHGFKVLKALPTLL